ISSQRRRLGRSSRSAPRVATAVGSGASPNSSIWPSGRPSSGPDSGSITTAKRTRAIPTRHARAACASNPPRPPVHPTNPAPRPRLYPVLDPDCPRGVLRRLVDRGGAQREERASGPEPDERENDRCRPPAAADAEPREPESQRERQDLPRPDCRVVELEEPVI